MDGEITTAATAREREGRLDAWKDPGHWALMVLHVAGGFAAAMLLHALVPALFRSRVASACASS